MFLCNFLRAWGEGGGGDGKGGRARLPVPQGGDSQLPGAVRVRRVGAERRQERRGSAASFRGGWGKKLVPKIA
jgi:hypothetical protein